MGQHMSDLYRAKTDPPGVNPGPDAPIKHDPMYGFPEGRKERVMQCTKEQFDAHNIHMSKRDFCGHLYIDYKKCVMDKWPRASGCFREYHHWEHCHRDDKIIRMKEFERMRRLNLREYNKRIKEEKEAKMLAAEEMED